MTYFSGWSLNDHVLWNISGVSIVGRRRRHWPSIETALTAQWSAWPGQHRVRLYAGICQSSVIRRPLSLLHNHPPLSAVSTRLSTPGLIFINPLNPNNAKIFVYKPRKPLLFHSWLFLLHWNTGSTACTAIVNVFILTLRGACVDVRIWRHTEVRWRLQTSESDVYRRQSLTSPESDADV